MSSQDNLRLSEPVKPFFILTRRAPNSAQKMLQTGL